jgi:hypothetical protein
MIILTDALVSLRPNSTFILVEENYNKLTWLDNKTNAPTLEELQTEILRLQQIDNEKNNIKQTALNKLMALGLTEEEALALGK